ncbi:GNAT family protein [Croceicoccus sp. BE223]|uniref:GNAT family N-acetyltransferase n=1 Tax=Croceicoccus sp. BE223 TaxID=2817716 RepID=UPI00286517AE|nr:GNAT family protein [Croceicoccus sp. BE223]MDR7103572.1 RimJ/RimL family protein N-acetyltransferase [Croceicoccus sp. BE223]
MTDAIARTERLVLRPLARRDIGPLFEGFGDAPTMTYWSRAPFASEGELAAWAFPADPGASLVCVAADPVDDEALIYATLMPRARGQAEIGFLSRPVARGRGLAREALGLLIDHGFRSLGLRRIFADTDPDNAGANRLLAALSFTLEGRLRENWETHIGLRDSHIWGLLQGEWRQPPIARAAP